MSDLGRLLRERRRLSKVGFKQLYAATGLEPETLRKWEVGAIAEPPLRGVLLYAREVGISLDEIAAAALSSNDVSDGEHGEGSSAIADAARVLPAQPRERQQSQPAPKRRHRARP